MRNFQDSFEARKPSFTSAISICVSGDKKCSFLENLACFVFLKHPFWNSPFCLITDKMRCTFQSRIQNSVKHLKLRIFLYLVGFWILFYFLQEKGNLNLLFWSYQDFLSLSILLHLLLYFILLINSEVTLSLRKLLLLFIVVSYHTMNTPTSQKINFFGCLGLRPVIFNILIKCMTLNTIMFFEITL